MWEDGKIEEYKPLHFVACSPPACSCPTMDILEEEKRILIKDDFKGEVILTFTEFELLYTRFKEYGF